MTDVDYGDDDVNLIDDAPAAADADTEGTTDDPQGEPAPTAISVLDLLVTSLVDDPDAVRIDPMEQRGRVANAIRTIVRAAAVRDDVQVDVEFED